MKMRIVVCSVACVLLSENTDMGY